VKLPRDLSGDEVCRALKRLGFEFVRQTGSHRHYVKDSLHPVVAQFDRSADCPQSAAAGLAGNAASWDNSRSAGFKLTHYPVSLCANAP
jgi:predicted RNA binding protein YcfA (HicA-like mRNA interferase family)